jgi:putative transposase
LRKCLHGNLSNLIRKCGDNLCAEDLNYKSWQKIYGKSVGKRAPGMFISLVKQKFAMTGGTVTDIDPYKACLSQICPECGTRKKKKLSERVHKCLNCGYTLDRDLTSAALAICVDQKTKMVDLEKSKVFIKKNEVLLKDASDLFHK